MLVDVLAGAVCRRPAGQGVTQPCWHHDANIVLAGHALHAGFSSLVLDILPPPGLAARPRPVGQQRHAVVRAGEQVPGPLLAAEGLLAQSLQVGLAKPPLPACSGEAASASPPAHTSQQPTPRLHGSAPCLKQRASLVCLCRRRNQARHSLQHFSEVWPP